MILNTSHNLLAEAVTPARWRALEQRVASLPEVSSTYKSVRVVEHGRRKNSAGETLDFARFVLLSKKERLDTIEVLSRNDAELSLVHGAVLFRSHVPDRTLYLKRPVPLATFFGDLASATPLRENVMILSTVATLVMTVLSLVFTGRWLLDTYRADRDETNAKVDAERRLNEFLFRGQTGKESVFESYGAVSSYIRNMIGGKGRGVILYGMPGTGKSYQVRRTLHFAGLQPDRDYTIVKGSSASAEENIKIIYSTLYKYNGKIIVFDDFDSALSDPNTINLLKAALDSYPVRIVSMPDMASYQVGGSTLPSRFEFTGKIVMITNMKEIDPALMSRTQAVALNFSPEEFRDNIGKMLEYISPEIDKAVKQEVFDHLQECVARNPAATIDFRRFSALVDLRLAYPETWKSLAQEILYPRK